MIRTRDLTLTDLRTDVRSGVAIWKILERRFRIRGSCAGPQNATKKCPLAVGVRTHRRRHSLHWVVVKRLLGGQLFESTWVDLSSHPAYSTGRPYLSRT